MKKILIISICCLNYFISIAQETGKKIILGKWSVYSSVTPAGYLLETDSFEISVSSTIARMKSLHPNTKYSVQDSIDLRKKLQLAISEMNGDFFEFKKDGKLNAKLGMLGESLVTNGSYKWSGNNVMDVKLGNDPYLTVRIQKLTIHDLVLIFEDPENKGVQMMTFKFRK